MNIKIKNIEVFKDILDITKLENSFYSPITSINLKKINILSPFLILISNMFFSILNENNIDYALFAGSSVGYIRNKKQVPWDEDFDIILLKEQINIFKIKIIPILEKFNFNVFDRKDYINSGCTAYYSIDKNTFFYCDIFYSEFDENNHLKNIGEDWGLYNRKKLIKDKIYPFELKEFHNKKLNVKFFKDINYEVDACYGDVINNVVINVEHQLTEKIKIYFKELYDDFEKIENISINNTKEKYNIKNYVSNKLSKLVLSENSYYNLDTLIKKIIEKNVSKIIITNINYLKFVPDIKFYFENINIELYLLKFEYFEIVYLNYINTVKCSTNNILNEFQQHKYLLVNKPFFKLITVITFGTFDLFHYGHINIIKNCYNYGENIVIGVSSDKFNGIKNKKSSDNQNVRIQNVKNYAKSSIVFLEESMELKQDYINKYNADILIMGDDWKNKFNFVNCLCIYTSRTENISSTELKKFDRSNNILNAGGFIENYGYTNSYEGIKHNINLGYKIIELDVLQLKDDSFVICHDNFEKKIYDLDKCFDDITYNEYVNLKIYNKYTPMTFNLLKKIKSENKNIIFILDTKFKNSKIYEDFLIFLKKEYGDINFICMQYYNDMELKLLVKYNFKKCLFATWKNFTDFKFNTQPTSLIYLKESLSYLKKNNMNLFGVSIHGINFEQKRISDEYLNFCRKNDIKILLFTHKYHDIYTINKLNEKNIYLFLKYTINDIYYLLPEDFNYIEYKYLNPDLLNMKEYELIEHYINCGKKENRKYKFEIPYDFNDFLYKQLNYDLNKMNSLELKVHFTNFHKIENRLYQVTTKFFNFRETFHDVVLTEYKILNQDIKNFNDEELIRHYIDCGKYENRKYKFKNLPKDFNPEIYKNLHEDLKNLTNNELIVHYENNGFFEGRLYK